MPSQEEFEAWVKANPGANHRAAEQRMINGVAVAMSGLKGDPHWKVFCDHIEPLRLVAEAKITRLSRELLDGPIVADYVYQEQKRQLAISKTQFDTYTQVISMIDALINRGEHLTPPE